MAARAHIQHAAILLAVAAAVFVFAYDGGGYGADSRYLAGVLVWTAVLFVLASGLSPARRPPPPAALVAGTALTALAALAGVSASWAPSPERALEDASRTLFYAGLFFLIVLVASRDDRGRWLDGLALGITAVVVVALVSRFFPSVFGSESILRLRGQAVWRLSYPIGYWNGLAVFAALGVPLLLRAALAARHPLLRGLALAPLPAFAAVLYLTSSRGGTLAALASIFVFFALVRRRAATVAALAVAGASAAFAVLVLRDRHELVDRAFTTAVGRQQGHEAALWILVACVATGVVYAALAAFGSYVRVRSKVETAVLAAGVIAIVAAVVAVHPVQRFDDFRRLPSAESAGSVESHLLSSSGTGRWQLWESAIDQFRTRPVLGQGAGSYERWFTRHATIDDFVQDAHSMYLQTLGELGVVGLTLLVAALGAGFGAGVLTLRRSDEEENLTVAALLAALGAFAVSLVFDWTWQLPAVGAVGVVLLALLCAGGAPRIGQARPFAAALGVVAAAAIVFLSLQLLSQLQVDESRRRAGDGDLDGAVNAAVQARALAPWNATPSVQVALLAERGGNLGAARAWIGEAIRRDRSDWRLWVTAARIEAESGAVERARRSLAHARVLNPRLPLPRE